MHNEVAVSRGAVAVPVGAHLAYMAKQALLWLAVPLSLYLVFVTQMPAVHDSTHTARHNAGWFKCH